MKKLILREWTDKQGQTVARKVNDLTTAIDKTVDAFKTLTEKIQSDNKTTIPDSFNPDQYR
jgi:hypothetical protein